MEKASALPPITEQVLTPQMQKELVAGDDKQYNDLAVKHNNLVDHIKKFCQ